MKHKHTHPNWKNLSNAEKANVRKNNWKKFHYEKLKRELPDMIEESSGALKKLYQLKLDKMNHPDYNIHSGMLKEETSLDIFYQNLELIYENYLEQKR
tara:strand:- start:55 stop:348 length:294 start_codon:yes stop_codon:yes gene_type:complete